MDPLKHWKAKSARLLNSVDAMKDQIMEYDDGLAFPKKKEEFVEYVLTKKPDLLNLQKTVQRKETLLQNYTTEGLTILKSILDDDVRAASEADYDNYSKQIFDKLDLLDVWNSTLDYRLIEIRERMDFVGFSSTGQPPPAVATTPTHDAPRRQPIVANRDNGSGSDEEHEDRQSLISWGGSPRNRPKQQLPKFNGNVRKFASFWSGFACMVHNAEDLTDLDKFFYLRQALKDDALRLIEEIPVTEKNYSKAVELLKDSYDLGASMTTVVLADIQKMRPASTSTKSIRDTLESLRQKVITLECHGEEFKDSNVWRSLVLAKFPASVCSHVIKEERRLPKSASGTPGAFSVKELLRELADHVQLLECIDLNTEAHSDSPRAPTERTHGQRNDQKKKTYDKKFSKRTFKCICSADDHRPQDCSKFSTPSARRQEAKRIGACHKCFEIGHLSRDCDALGPCPKCNGPHHSSLCLDSESKKFEKPAATPPATPAKPKSSSGAVACNQEHAETQDSSPSLCVNEPLRVQNDSPDQIVLMQVTGQLFNEDSKTYGNVNVFIDDGAAISLIRSPLIDSFRLNTKGPFSTKVSGVGGQIMDLSYNLAKATIRSSAFGEPDRILNLKTIPEICQPLQTAKLLQEDWNRIKELGICVNSSSSPRSNVDILIGQDYRQYFVYEESPRIRLPSGLLLTKTVFGYAISGCTSTAKKNKNSAPPATTPMVGVFSVPDDSPIVVAPIIADQARLDLQKDLHDLYSLENLGIRTDKDSNEMKIIDFMDDYRKTITFKNGEVEAGFPFLDSVDKLKNNINVAVKQLQNQLRNLQKKPEHLDLYEATFADYVRQGFIEEVSLHETAGITTFYLPHHPVISPEKSTSFRVVFNASSHALGELSLNDVIFPGYALNAIIYEILLKFRSYDFAMTSDIAKAFLQIRLPEDHRDATRFLWIRNKDRPATGSNLKVFRFCRVPFGINASPCVLNQVILKHLELVNTSTSKEIAHTLYVDNVLLGGTSTEQLITKFKESKELFAQIGMCLRDYLSNSPEANAAIPEEDRSVKTTIKVLRIPWNALDDSVSLSIQRKPSKKLTTRSVLSQVNGSCFDPLGLMSPFLLRAKVFLQDLHKKKRGWNDSLTDEETTEWNQILEEMIGAAVSLPRRVTQLTDVMSRKLMVFSDSSKKAYGCAAYVVTTTTTGFCYSRLLTAKMKITPIKELTIPRLELTGIFIAANLALTILKESELSFDEAHFFSDSTIALSWIKSKRLLPPFVKELANKIQKSFDRIKEQIPMDIYHVPTADNVADIATRGLSKDCPKDHVWWTGPRWITQERRFWPVTEPSADCVALFPAPVNIAAAEGKRLFDIEGGLWPVSRVSSFNKLKRIVAYVIRFIKHASRGRCLTATSQEEHKNLIISGKEMILAERHILRQEQNKTDIAAMQKECKKLNLNFDKDGLLRKCSRLNNSHLPFDQANPIFVPSKSLLSTLIVRHYHYSHFHRKGKHLQSIIQEKFWIPKLKKICETIGKKCPVCAVYGRPYKYPLLSDLPPERVQRSAPFAYTGTDLFGPILVRTSDSSEEKRWIALFTCFTTRMVHLEIVRDQSARAYLLALQRFMARRGVPLRIWSDNGTNFTLSWKMIKDQQERSEPPAEELHSFVASHHIQWSFIPPGAPWMGGTWERMVGLVKRPLIQAIGRRRVEEDLLHTLLCGVEATINSRPLYCSTTEGEDPEILRPIDFCQPKIRLCIPPNGPIDEEDPDYLPAPLVKSHSQAKKAIQEIESGLDRFWKRFHSDYLLSLKGIFNKREMDYSATATTPKIGDIVLLDEENHTPRHLWQRGMIEALTPSKDGSVRSASVRLSNGHVLLRPVNKLIPLEITADTIDSEDNDEEPPVDAVEEPPIRQRLPRQAKKSINYVEAAVVPAAAVRSAVNIEP